MKLYKESKNAEPELIAESEIVEELKQRAVELAGDHLDPDRVWDWVKVDNDKWFMEVKDSLYRFAIRPE